MPESRWRKFNATRSPESSRAAGPADVSKDVAFGDCIAVPAGTLNRDLLRDVMKCPDNNRPARQDEVLLGNELSTSLHIGADNSLGCDVAEAQIFLESEQK